MKAKIQQAWADSALPVLGVLLNPRFGNDHLVKFFEHGGAIHHFPPYLRSLFTESAKPTVNSNKSPEIMATNTGLTVDYIMGLMQNFSSRVDRDNFEANLNNLIRWQHTHELADIMSDSLTRLESPLQLDHIKGDLMQVILSQTTASRLVDVTGTGIADRLDEFLSLEPMVGYPTGHGELDDAMLGGIQPGSLLLLVGAFKSQKTRLMLNAAIETIRAGGNAVILSYEMREYGGIGVMLTAMLAAEWLYQNGYLNNPEMDGLPAGAISAREIIKYRRQTLQWQYRGPAIQYATDEIRGWGHRLRIYDATPNHGGLSDIGSLTTVMSIDQICYPAYPPSLYTLDFVQKIQTSGNIAEQAQELSNTLQRQVTSQTPPPDVSPFSLMVLAQRNTAMLDDTKSYSSGVSGGQAFENSADDVVVTTGKHDYVAGIETPYRLFVQLKRSRFSSPTGVLSWSIHPPTGRLLPETIMLNM